MEAAVDAIDRRASTGSDLGNGDVAGGADEDHIRVICR